MADPASNIPAYRQPGVLDRYSAERSAKAGLMEDFTQDNGTWMQGQIKKYGLSPDESMAVLKRTADKWGAGEPTGQFLDVLASNDRLKKSFFGVMQRDPGFVNGIQAMAKDGGGVFSPDKLKDVLKQPGAVDAMVAAMDNVGKEVNGKKVGFEDIKKFADDSLKMAETLDPEFGKKSGMTPDQIKAEKEKRKKNFSSAMSGVGVDEGVVASAYGQKAGMDILKKMFSGDTRGAIQGVEDLMLQSGMDPEQAKALMKLVAPVIGLTSEFMKPYAEFADFYGPQFTSWAKQASGGKIDLANLSGETPRGDRTSASASGAAIKTANIDLGKTFTAEHDGAGNGYKKDVVVPTVATPRPDYGQPAFGTFG